MKSKSPLIIILAIAVIGIGGYLVINNHKSPASSAATTTGAVATNAVKISNYMYAPMVITVKAGTTVTWTNEDSVHHSVTADTASPDAPNGPLFGQNQTYSFTFNKAGTYTIHCELHPYMHGTVVVTS